MKKWGTSLRSLLVTLFVAFGILSIGLTGENPTTASTEKIVSNRKQVVVPSNLEPTPWLEKASSLTSLKDFMEITTGGWEKRLVRSLLDDEFDEGNPFAQLSSHYPLAVLLAKGIREFTRTTYRTTAFQGDVGYDLLTYEVVHNDGTHSEIMAYLDKSSDVASDALGARVTFVVFNVFESSNLISYNLYRNNVLEDHGSIPSTDALAMVNRRVSASVPFMAISAR